MDNMSSMPEKKEPSFKCPACGEMLKVETKGEDMSEDSGIPKKSKMNTGNMPMSSLRSKITPPSPNLNSY
jgi:hypothetical protein